MSISSIILKEHISKLKDGESIDLKIDDEVVTTIYIEISNVRDKTRLHVEHLHGGRMVSLTRYDDPVVSIYDDCLILTESYEDAKTKTVIYCLDYDCIEIMPAVRP